MPRTRVRSARSAPAETGPSTLTLTRSARLPSARPAYSLFIMRRRRRVLIAGAAGRDFHDFNVAFRAREDTEVVAFTATQIPNIAGRRYPPELSGDRYPAGIPIHPEEELEELIRSEGVFSYSDVTHEHVMHVASSALAAGAGFRLLSPAETQLVSAKPVVSVCAVRTGSGKSQTARHVAGLLRDAGRRVAVLRHPMP